MGTIVVTGAASEVSGEIASAVIGKVLRLESFHYTVAKCGGKGLPCPIDSLSSRDCTEGLQSLLSAVASGPSWIL